MSSRFSSKQPGSVAGRMPLSVVVEEEPVVSEFGQMLSLTTTPPRPSLSRSRATVKSLLPLRQAAAAGRALGPVPFGATMTLPPSPPDSPGVFDLGVQNMLYNQARADTPPYSDEDEDDAPECTTPSNEETAFPPPFVSPPVSIRAVGKPTDFAPSFALPLRRPSARASLPLTSGPQRTSSPPTLEQITQRLKEANPAFSLQHPVVPRRRASEPPASPPRGAAHVSSPSAPTSPARADTLPSRLPTFLLNRARSHPPPKVPGTPSSSSYPASPSSPPRVGSAAKPRPSAPLQRWAVQEIPTFKLTPPPPCEQQREASGVRLREVLAARRAGAPATSAEQRRKSTGNAPGGLRVPSL